MSQELTPAESDEEWLRQHATFKVTDHHVDQFIEKVAVLMSDLKIDEKRARVAAIGLVKV